MNFREQAHVKTLERRRDYLANQLNAGTWKGNPAYAVAEHDALDWAVGLLCELVDCEQVRETNHVELPS